MNTSLSFLGIIFLLATVNLIAQTDAAQPIDIPSELNTTKKKKPRPNLAKRIVYFDTNETEMNTKSQAVLDDLANLLNDYQSLDIQISGHSNGNCDTEFCIDLSNARAESVAFYLLEKGVRPDRFQYHGYGKQKPVASNRTTTGKKRNQRVEIRLLIRRQ